MLVKPNVEELLKKADNRYELVIAVSKRARQLQEYDVKDVKSKISKAANDFESGECYIVRDNEEETEDENKGNK